jgi:hypothetical protein
MKTEPVAVAASIVGAVHAILALLVLLRVLDLTVDQLVAVDVAVQAVLAVPLALFVRGRVSPNSPN